MYKISVIARWEFIERIKRKSFIISMIVLPLLVVAFSLLPSFLLNKGEDYPLPLGIVDLTRKYEVEFSKELVKQHLPNGQPAFFTFNLSNKTNDKAVIMEFADKQVLSDGLVGYVIIEENENVIDITFRTNSIFNLEKLNLIEETFNKVAVKLFAKKENLSRDKIDELGSESAVLTNHT